MHVFLQIFYRKRKNVQYSVIDFTNIFKIIYGISRSVSLLLGPANVFL
jgi:hypothetical protein